MRDFIKHFLVSLRYCLLVMIFLLFISIKSNAHESEQLTADTNDQIKLCGILHREVRWGPPNFGENPKIDSKFTVWLISLGSSIYVRYRDEKGLNDVVALSEIQLSIDKTKISQASLKRMDGKNVNVLGSLWRGSSQGDVTLLVLDVFRLTLDKNKCAQRAARVKQ